MDIGRRSLQPHMLIGLMGMALAVLAAPFSIYGEQNDDKWHITDTSPKNRPNDFSLLMGLSPLAQGLAAGLRFAFPLKHHGFIPEINDAVFLDIGGHLSYGIPPGSWDQNARQWEPIWTAQIPIHLRWNFYVNQSWTVFASAGTAFRIPFVHQAHPGLMAVPWPAGGIGAFFQLQESLALRMDIGSDITSMGLTWFP